MPKVIKSKNKVVVDKETNKVVANFKATHKPIKEEINDSLEHDFEDVFVLNRSEVDADTTKLTKHHKVFPDGSVEDNRPTEHIYELGKKKTIKGKEIKNTEIERFDEELTEEEKKELEELKNKPIINHRTKKKA